MKCECGIDASDFDYDPEIHYHLRGAFERLRRNMADPAWRAQRLIARANAEARRAWNLEITKRLPVRIARA